MQYTTRMKNKRFAEFSNLAATVKPTESTDRLPVIVLQTRHASNHPWLFRRMTQEPKTPIEAGTIVEVVDKFRTFVGRGFYNSHSEIAVRLLTLDKTSTPDKSFFMELITRAVALRHDVLGLPKVTDSYRLIHSEGDGLSGLIADKYGRCIVLEIFSAGIHRHLNWIRDGFKQHFPDCEIVVRCDPRTERLEGVPMNGPPPRNPELTIHENTLKMHVNLKTGHKTGYFLDQRENRKRIAELCAGQTVLDGFCYTGGFALSAAIGGAKTVEGIDLDEKAIEVANRNRVLNRLSTTLTFTHGNVFDILRERRVSGQRYSRMILDPAKLALTRAEVPKALSAYADMNKLGMLCLQPGGVLLSCSCTGLVSEEDFIMALRASAAEAKVELQILAVHGAPADHPWAVRVPEGRYLKAVFSRVTPLK
jgi:23S rRNA (cytosine1962-C5)-methyltransferase